MPPEGEDEELEAMRRMYSGIAEESGAAELEGLSSKYGPQAQPGEPDAADVAGVDESEGEVEGLEDGGEMPPEGLEAGPGPDEMDMDAEAGPVSPEGLEDIPPELLEQLMADIAAKGRK
jgi:hypothetical protein